MSEAKPMSMEEYQQLNARWEIESGRWVVQSVKFMSVDEAAAVEYQTPEFWAMIDHFRNDHPDWLVGRAIVQRDDGQQFGVHIALPAETVRQDPSRCEAFLAEDALAKAINAGMRGDP